jgi:predicted dehydrogenase
MEERQIVKVGIIGAGERGVYTLGARMAERFKQERFLVTALADINPTRLEEGKQFLEKRYRAEDQQVSLRTYTNFQELIEDPEVDLILITTYTSKHIESALPALRSGKHVYLDKPIATRIEDSYRILQVEKEEGNPLIMGFTRRYETSWRKAYQLLSEGTIGSLQMILLRSVIPYSRYLQRWHRNHALSGGALNDKASHHFDVFNWFSGGRPETIQAMGGRSSVFTPDPQAPKRCRECDRECPYRVLPSDTVPEVGVYYRLEKEYSEDEATLFTQPSWFDAVEHDEMVDNCVYDPEADIFDHAVVNVGYSNGVKATLFLSIFGPVAEDQETLELVGSSGRISLVRNSGRIDLVNHYGAHHELIEAADDNLRSSHNGADIGLLKDMRGFCEGLKPVAQSRDGHLSLRMVHAAEKAIEEGGATIPMREVPFEEV